MGCVLLDGWVKSLLVIFAIWAGVLSNDLSTFDVYKDDEEFLAFLFFFQNVRHRIPTSVTEGISFGHCRYFHAWPTPQFAHNDSLH